MIVALMLSIGAVAQAENKITRANNMYQQGMFAMNEGKYDIAKMSFREALRNNPKHLLARQKLLYISKNRNSLDIQNRKNVLRRVIIPKVDLDKASLQESLDILAVQIERISQQKVTPNFIIQDPKGTFQNRKVTLRLNRIPAETTLRYIVEQVGAHIRYDNHAIVIIPAQKIITKP